MSIVIKTNQINTLGIYSALFSSVFVVIFALSLILSFLTPSETLSFTAAFLLAPCFVVMIISIHYSTLEENKIWSHIGITFSTIYAVMVTITYYIQLAVVRSNPLDLSEEVMKPFIYSTPGSVIFAIDMLGYAFMTLTTLVTAPVFSKEGLEGWIRRLFLLHGILVIPTLLFPLLLSQPSTNVSESSDDLFAIIALTSWSIVFVSLSGLVMIYFKNKKDDKTLINNDL